jgi:hypothetical protein
MFLLSLELLLFVIHPTTTFFCDEKNGEHKMEWYSESDPFQMLDFISSFFHTVTLIFVNMKQNKFSSLRIEIFVFLDQGRHLKGQ